MPSGWTTAIMSHPPSDDPPTPWDDIFKGKPEHHLDDLTKWRNDKYTCDGTITREFEEDACGKPAVAALTTWDDWHGRWYTWPVCAYHANRYGKHGEMVPLHLLLAKDKPPAV